MLFTTEARSTRRKKNRVRLRDGRETEARGSATGKMGRWTEDRIPRLLLPVARLRSFVFGRADMRSRTAMRHGRILSVDAVPPW